MSVRFYQSFLLAFGFSMVSYLYAQSTLWSAEITIQTSTDPENEGKDRCYQILRKPLSEAMEKADEFVNYPMGGFITQAIFNGDIQVYKDANLTQAFGSQDIEKYFGGPDTIAMYDPVSYEEVIEVVPREPSPNDFHFVGLNIQLEYEDDGSISQSIPYGYIDTNPSNDLWSDAFRYLYFPVRVAKRPLKFNKRKWNMIDQHRVQLPISAMAFDENSQLTTSEMLDQILEMVESGSDDDFVRADGTFSVLPELDREMFQESIDTVITFDPVDFSQEIVLVPTRSAASSIGQIRLVQFWAWDAKRAELTILPIGYSPISRVEDVHGNLLYELPLFYHIPRRFRE